MTNEEILKKAIEKAKENGYELPYTDLWCANCETSTLIEEHDYIGDEDLSLAIIFNKEFAKALWGEKEVCPTVGTDSHMCCDASFTGACIHIPEYQYHLREMVLEEDPVQYLKEFI
jgi:hypothetical protein|tara:strand:- start:53 stop:400 length:348 start_codon:yes stop_codon:yes gene_type:complete